ncbi:hypothetical protein BT69DRAFT_1342356 [Atractiella rhizophila]|nr:hypothetical protein BT69DRAFT_1342356 [Atractiella rhizophila]
MLNDAAGSTSSPSVLPYRREGMRQSEETPTLTLIPCLQPLSIPPLPLPEPKSARQLQTPPVDFLFAQPNSRLKVGSLFLIFGERRKLGLVSDVKKEDGPAPKSKEEAKDMTLRKDGNVEEDAVSLYRKIWTASLPPPSSFWPHCSRLPIVESDFDQELMAAILKAEVTFYGASRSILPRLKPPPTTHCHELKDAMRELRPLRVLLASADVRPLGTRRIIVVDIPERQARFANRYVGSGTFMPAKSDEGEQRIAHSRRLVARRGVQGCRQGIAGLRPPRRLHGGEACMQTVSLAKDGGTYVQVDMALIRPTVAL